MATKTKRSTEAKCIPIETLTRRLAESFNPISWSATETLATDDAANWLEVHGEDVEALIAAGLLAATKRLYSQDRVALTELARFLSENPWWFRVRAEKQLQHLRDEIEAMAHRDRFARRMARARKASGKAVAA